MLISLVERIESLDKPQYISKTWDNLSTVLVTAKEVIDDSNALYDEVSETYKALLKAFLNLRLKPNKDKLQELINKTEVLSSNNKLPNTGTPIASSAILAFGLITALGGFKLTKRK